MNRFHPTRVKIWWIEQNCAYEIWNGTFIVISWLRIISSMKHLCILRNGQQTVTTTKRCFVSFVCFLQRIQQQWEEEEEGMKHVNSHKNVNNLYLVRTTLC